MTGNNEIIQVAKQAAAAAATILLRHFGNTQIRQKSSQNLVTQADIESEEAIVAIIQQSFPTHKVLREEGASTGSANSEHLWVIDPLDATNNFAHGIPHFAISIGYAEQGAVRAGVILDPLRDELFWAVDGMGAFLNEARIHVSQHATVDDCIMATGFYYDRGEVVRQTLASIGALFQANVRGIRRTGSAAIDLAWVACGRFQGFFEYRLAPWDYAAGWLIVRQAGGKCSDRSGDALQLDSGNIIAANGMVFPSLLDIVRWRKT